MGLGGDLLYTSVARSLSAARNSRVCLAYTPGISDLARGRLWDSSRIPSDRPIFHHNPKVYYPAGPSKPAWLRRLDLLALKALHKLRLFPLYERFVFWLSLRFARAPYIYLNMEHISYGEKTLADRIIWKKGGHAIDIILRQYGQSSLDHRCEIFFTEAEKASWPALRQRLGLPESFFLIEPSTNQEWFGELRAWPMENWRKVAEKLAGKSPALVQVGVASGDPPLAGAIDIRGKTSIRELALVMTNARLFVGTEGGLMHMANAAQCPAVILWGGITLPEFIGYQEYQRVLCHYVACAPCGLLGNCPNGKICMNSFTVAEVHSAIEAELQK